MHFHIFIITLAVSLALAACGRIATSGPGVQVSPSPQVASSPAATVATPSTATPLPRLPTSAATAAIPGTAIPSIQPAPSATAIIQQPAEATPTETVPQISPRPAIDTVVIYHKSGGFAGISETMTVYSDGRVELIKRGAQTQQIQLQPAELASLKQLLSNSEFAAVQSPTMPSMADAFNYEVTVPSPGGKDHIVKTSDGAQNPPVLDKVLDELGRLRKQIRE